MPKMNLEKLKAQKEKLEARIQLVENWLKTSERKKETQRKILVGAYYLDKARQQGKMEELKGRLEGYLKRESDRKLFDLPVTKATTEKKEKELIPEVS